MLTRVIVGGVLSNNKGINLPGVAVSVPAMSDKDIEDLRWALHLRADLVALSFVRSAADVDLVRKVMEEENERVPVIAKIEKPQAIEHIEEIVDAFDAIMVARGDLGVEMPLEDVPVLQKQMVEAARRNAKPAIVATQMLESMISSPRPTRAEASDVANAVLDGADAVMLSGETSVGAFPIESVRVMARIIESTEDHGLARMTAINWQPKSRGGVIAKAAAEVAERIGAKYLVAFSQSGDTVKRLTRYRSQVPVLAFTPEPAVRSQLAMSWGVETFLVETVQHTDEMVMQVDRALLDDRPLRRGRHRGDRGRQPARHPRLDERAARPPDGRCDQRRRRRPTARSRRAGDEPCGWPRWPLHRLSCSRPARVRRATTTPRPSGADHGRPVSYEARTQPDAAELDGAGP